MRTIPCNTATGASVAQLPETASETCNTPTGANASSMYPGPHRFFEGVTTHQSHPKSNIAFSVISQRLEVTEGFLGVLLAESMSAVMRHKKVL